MLNIFVCRDPKIQLINHNFSNEGWSLENGYPINVDITTYPLRAGQDGQIAGLSIVMINDRPETDYACGNPIRGFKV